MEGEIWAPRVDEEGDERSDAGERRRKETIEMRSSDLSTPLVWFSSLIWSNRFFYYYYYYYNKFKDFRIFIYLVIYYL
ncbi:hypothetical protein HanIR_Chr01g0044311 [Helianthus annuus]|nr:hypothetical protein HanIR_Chr01g0044311 [Helianthus annuus]